MSNGFSNFDIIEYCLSEVVWGGKMEIRYVVYFIKSIFVKGRREIEWELEREMKLWEFLFNLEEIIGRLYIDENDLVEWERMMF